MLTLHMGSTCALEVLNLDGSEWSLKAVIDHVQVASVFGGLELKRKNRDDNNREDVQKKAESEHREPLAGPRFSNGSVEQRGILGAPYKGSGEVDVGGWGGGGDSGSDSWGWEGGRPMNALAVVKAMVAGCLLSHTTALPIDSVNIHHRMLAKEVSPFEIDALHEVGEGGGVSAVDYALRAMTEAGGLQIEDIENRFGGLHVLVLNFDRGRLIANCLPPPHHPRPDVWDHPPMFPPVMARPPRAMGMLGMPGGGPGFPAFPRPPHGPGLHAKGRGPADEDDIDALLHKKSFKEQQQSKTAEELLELLHRPTAKETANAAKVSLSYELHFHNFVNYFTLN